jgi:two-component system sensor histidine kinase RpfC
LGTLRELLKDRPAGGVLDTADGRVTDITTHPRFQANTDMIVDRRVLRDLADLDDTNDGFVAEVVAEFISDTEDLLVDLRQAIAIQDYAEFRDILHAMRSSSANVGAAQVHAICEQLQNTDRMSFIRRGPEFLARLHHEFTRFRVEARTALGPVDDESDLAF